MALTTLAQIKASLGISPTNTSGDAQLAALQPAAEQIIVNFCQRDFTLQSYQEYYSGNNTQRFVLRQRPVTSVTALYVNSSGYFGTGPTLFDSTTQLLEGQDWVLDRPTQDGAVSLSGVVYRIGTVWPVLNRINTLDRLTPYQGPTWGNILVSYTAGYSTIPGDVQYAVALLVAYMKNTAKYGGFMMESERLGDYSYRLHDAARNDLVLGSLLSTLAHYREIPW